MAPRLRFVVLTSLDVMAARVSSDRLPEMACCRTSSRSFETWKTNGSETFGISMPDHPVVVSFGSADPSRPKILTILVSQHATFSTVSSVRVVLSAALYSVIRLDIARIAAGVSKESQRASWTFA